MNLHEWQDYVRSEAGLDETYSASPMGMVLKRDTPESAVQNMMDAMSATLRGMVDPKYHRALTSVLGDLMHRRDTKDRIAALVNAVLRGVAEEAGVSGRGRP